MLRISRHPARAVALAFLLVTIVGAGLLTLPVATAAPEAADPLTALFTAVSAVCVTGLIVVDTPSYWSDFGETVIAVLIQVGGFGIMTFASLLGMAVLGRWRLAGRLVAQAETKTIRLGDVRGVVLRVGLITLTVELVIAVILFARWRFGYGYDIATAAWHSVFHSISAFNNAGFALYPDSLESFATDEIIMLPITLAVIIGGIGFPVLVELARKVKQPRQWSTHTKITLTGTAVLLLVGFVTYLGLEWRNPHTIGAFGWLDKIQSSFVASVMPRTAGFNAIPIGELQHETLAVTDVLMFIGGGSGGTAGGIKVATFFLLWFVILAEIRGEPNVSVFNRNITAQVQRQALTVVLLGVGAVGAATIALLTLTDHPLDAVVFEAVSAFATVGLSTGITAEVGSVGQLILIVLMFMGRVGTITFATALALRSRPMHYRFPDERPIVG